VVVDPETGIKKNNRIWLNGAANRAQAVKAMYDVLRGICKENGAVLLVAKLCRLSRNLHFITTLQDSKIEFCAADNPHAIPSDVPALSCADMRPNRCRAHFPRQFSMEPKAPKNPTPDRPNPIPFSSSPLFWFLFWFGR